MFYCHTETTDFIDFFYCHTALELCSLATEGTQEITENTETIFLRKILKSQCAALSQRLKNLCYLCHLCDLKFLSAQP